jgi:hypothetical protein
VAIDRLRVIGRAVQPTPERQSVGAGEDRAHCAGCHTIFDSIVLFDVHRDGGSCLRPQVLGLVATKNGIWQEHASKRRVAGS